MIRPPHWVGHGIEMVTCHFGLDTFGAVSVVSTKHRIDQLNFQERIECISVGSMGSCLGSPFFLVKTHMQSYADTKVAVGFQRKHEGMMSAFRKIYAVRGIRGLYRGVIGNIPRAALGSGAQLATFEPLKDYMRRNNLSFTNPTLNSFVCSTIAGTAMAITITPPDVILTRLYNQPLDDAGKGKYYSGVTDCLIKIIKTEGPSALYKGFWPSYLRVAPHSTLVLVFYDEAKAMRDKFL